MTLQHHVIKALNDFRGWGCSIITSRVGGGWVSGFFVMLRDGIQEGIQEYLMEGRNVTVKKS